MAVGYEWIAVAPVVGLAAHVAMHLLLARREIFTRLYTRMMVGAAAGFGTAAGPTLFGGTARPPRPATLSPSRS